MPVPTSTLPALARGNVAVVTGAASGIGFAAARRFAEMGLRVAAADRAGPALEHALGVLSAVASGGPEDVIAVACDVTRPAELARLAEETATALGPVSVLMINAGSGDNPG